MFAPRVAVEWKLTVTLPEGWVTRTTLKVAVPPDSVVTSRGGVAGSTEKPAVSLSLLMRSTSAGRTPATYLSSEPVFASKETAYCWLPSCTGGASVWPGAVNGLRRVPVGVGEDLFF